MPAGAAVPGDARAAHRRASGAHEDLAWLETAALRIAHAGTAHYPPGAIIGPRRIPDLELVWVDSGTASYEDGSGRRQQLVPGDVLLVRPGERHRFVMERRRMLAHGFAHFSAPAAVMRRITAWPGGPVHAAPGSDLRAAVAACGRLLANSPSGSAAPRLALRLALALFRRAASGEAEPAWMRWRLDPRVAAVLTAIRRTWAERPAWTPDAPELARIAGCSAPTLGRAFRGALGVAPLTAVRLWRVERAAILLARGGMGVAEAAAQLGWRDPDVFARAFRAAYGLSPREAVRQAAAGGWTATPRLRLVCYAGGGTAPALAVDDPSLPVLPVADDH